MNFSFTLILNKSYDTWDEEIGVIIKPGGFTQNVSENSS